MLGQTTPSAATSLTKWMIEAETRHRGRTKHQRRRLVTRNHPDFLQTASLFWEVLSDSKDHVGQVSFLMCYYKIVLALSPAKELPVADLERLLRRDAIEEFSWRARANPFWTREIFYDWLHAFATSW